MQKINVIPSGDICDQRNLQSNKLKAFLAITHEEEFSQIQDLYSKIDNNINFYLSMFPAKLNDNIFENKALFWGHF